MSAATVTLASPVAASPPSAIVMLPTLSQQPQSQQQTNTSSIAVGTTTATTTTTTSKTTGAVHSSAKIAPGAHHKTDPPIAGLYELEHTIGQGHFAVVKSARHVFSGERVAIKIIDKQKLDPISRDHLFQEVY